MPILRGVLGYLAAILVTSLLFWGWQMSVLTKPWPAQRVWVEMALAVMPLAIVASVIPAFALRLIAVIFHQFNTPTAVVGGAVTGVAIYLYFLSTENMWDRVGGVVYELMAFATLGMIAGLVWFWIENIGATKE